MLNNCKKPNNGIIVPPIKSQGIKTKLVPWINDIIYHSGLDLPHTNWIEPFFGTGVVGLNAPVGGNRYVGDSNPYIINFYNGLLTSEINSNNMRQYLEKEGKLLSNAEEEGYAYYRKVKDRFNAKHSPFDFIFLSRAGFNGMMRFNRHGEWNIPFCKKPNRFAPAYITKICNQIAATQRIINRYHWEFYNQNFIDLAKIRCKTDLIKKLFQLYYRIYCLGKKK
ncbi:MAG: DNA adenine methylase [Prevotella sp.]|jgi:DNA adenine methylase|nr:DNA adenine methylase [Prevotella sp.]